MDNKRIYPKVLIITGNSMAGKTQTAITLRNIWKNWPSDKLLEIVIGETPINNDSRGNSFFLPLKRQPLSYLAKSGMASSLNKELKTNEKNIETSHQLSTKSFKEKTRQYMYCFIDRSYIGLKKNDLEIIKSFNPDIIYTMGSTVTVLKVANIISNKINISIILHFMDNWPETIQWGENNWLNGYQKLLRRWLKRTYKRSKCALTISEEMAHDYEEQTGIIHFPLMNTVNVEYWRCDKRRINTCINLVYAGGLHLGRDKTLLEIYRTIENSNNLERKCKLTIYTNTKLGSASELLECSDGNALIVKDAVPHEELIKVYAEADILLLAEAVEVDNTTETFARYSISTKTAEYLATGKPILYIGSKTRALAKYLLKNKAAAVIECVDHLNEAIEYIFINYDEISHNAVQLAYLNHDEKKIHTKLIDAINYSQEAEKRIF